MHSWTSLLANLLATWFHTNAALSSADAEMLLYQVQMNITCGNIRYLEVGVRSLAAEDLSVDFTVRFRF